MRQSLLAVLACLLAVVALRPKVQHDHGAAASNAAIAPGGESSKTAQLMANMIRDRADFHRLLNSSTNDAQRRALLLAREAEHDSAGQAVEAARENPSDPMSALSLGLVMTNFPRSSEGREAADLLAQAHLDDEYLDSTFDELEQSESDLAEKVLRAAYRTSPIPRVQGRAAYSLACLLKTRAEREAWSDPQVSRVRSLEARRIFEEFVKRHTDLRDSRGLLVDLARAQLSELASLPVGKTAPEIEGEDLEGRPMRLSDHRGKVVVVAFWGNWCSLCREMMPYERSLVERMRGRPFLMLGVNSDTEYAPPEATSRNEDITWRSWKDGGQIHGGRIAREWNVQALPDLFILDAEGVIRHHVGPHADDHEALYFLDAQGALVHRWQSHLDVVLEVAEALVSELEQARDKDSSALNPKGESEPKSSPGL